MRGTRIRTHLASPLYRNAYFLILGAGAGSLLGFVFWLLAARRYSAEAVGLNAVLISAMMLASGVCQLGLNAVLFRYLPGAGSSTRSLVVRSYGLTSVLSALVGLGAALTSNLWAPESDFVHTNTWWVVAFVVSTIAWTIFSLQDGVLTGLRQTHWVLVENSLFSAIKVALLPAFVGLSSLAGIFLAWNIPVLLSLVPVNVLIFRRLVPRHLKHGFEVTRNRRTILRLAAGNYLGTLFAMASTTLLPVIVAAEVGTTATAFFYIPWTIASALQLVALNMTTSLTVEVAYDESKLREYSRRVTLHTMRFVVPVAAILTVGAPYLLLAFGSDYSNEGASCLRLLALASIPNVIVMLGICVARIQHDGQMALVIPGAVSVITIGLSLILLPRVGIVGVGWASLVGQLVLAGWLVVGLLRPIFLRPALR